jgi:serine/threonine protein kinase
MRPPSAKPAEPLSPLTFPTTSPPVPTGGPVSAPTPTDPFGIVGTDVAGVFRVESVVAHGGFAVVYRANHLRFSAPVALKCLKIPAQLTATDRTEFLERFQKEGEVMFRLSSSISEIVRPLQFDSFKLPDGRLVPFIALEWLEGITLKDVIVQRLDEGNPPLSLAEAVTFLTPVARALARAHSLPSPNGPLCILHCDLKPDNIFVTELGGAESVRIFDFGIAKVRNAATRHAGGATSEGHATMFTPAYAAPEQWNPERFGQTGPWTDVFSLALTLAEVATQRPAIDGPPTAMLAQCLNDKVRPTPRRLGATTSDRVDQAFLRALAVDPRNRLQSIPRFWGELEQALGLPPVLGESARRTPSLVGVRLDPSELPRGSGPGTEAPLGLPSAPPPQSSSSPIAAQPRSSAGLAFAGELDLPGAAPAAPTPPASAPPASGPPASGPPASGPPASGPPASGQPAAFAQEAASPAPQPAPPGLSAPSTSIDGALPFDLADDPARPEPTPALPLVGGGEPALGPAALRASQAGIPAARASQAGMPAVQLPGGFAAARTSQAGMPAVRPSGAGFPAVSPQDELGEVAPPSVGNRERLQAAAVKATQVASTAAASAKAIAVKALEVDERHRIQLDQPATWIKPMLGPIIAMIAALLISVIAVVVNKMSGSNVSVVWISLPLMVASIGFAVFRWMKITKE